MATLGRELDEADEALAEVPRDVWGKTSCADLPVAVSFFIFVLQ